MPVTMPACAHRIDARAGARRTGCRSTGRLGQGAADAKNDEEIPAIVEVSDDLASQSVVERVGAVR